ncbi:MAG: pantoate--beta-alanine ligase [Acidimicrobiales bacterium]
MEVTTSKSAFRATVAALRRSGDRIGLVPTMGALHAGHLSLIEAAAKSTDHVVVSVFVNPLQFGQGVESPEYPRDVEGDLEMCRSAGAAAVFAPTEQEIYPSGKPLVMVSTGALGERLEGAFRPGHFEGVATVVLKLLNIVGECRAYFGEKDFQQLVIVRRLVEDLDVPAEIDACPTMRDPDGLAISSRNRLLGPKQRTAALALYRALEAGREAIESGERDAWSVESEMAHVLDSESRLVPSYAAVADPARLCPVETIDGEVRLLVAAELGSVRLIDNLQVTP